jgi:hypothetical protein
VQILDEKGSGNVYDRKWFSFRHRADDISRQKERMKISLDCPLKKYIYMRLLTAKELI